MKNLEFQSRLAATFWKQIELFFPSGRWGDLPAGNLGDKWAEALEVLRKELDSNNFTYQIKELAWISQSGVCIGAANHR
jgi:hypothetical protein